MKLKIILLSLFLFFSTSVIAESNENCLTSSGVEIRDGLYYLTGQDNPFTGTSKCVYSNTGQMQSLGEIRGGKKDGKWTEWFAGGQLQLEKSYKDGKLVGNWTWWGVSGRKREERNYKDDERDGKWTSWHANGQKLKEGSYKEGRLEGSYTEWHKNGQLKSEGVYIDGKLEGGYTEWNEFGRIVLERDYKNGKQKGILNYIIRNSGWMWTTLGLATFASILVCARRRYTDQIIGIWLRRLAIAFICCILLFAVASAVYVVGLLVDVIQFLLELLSGDITFI